MSFKDNENFKLIAKIKFKLRGSKNKTTSLEQITMQPLLFMSFNIRFDTWKDQLTFSWNYRKQMVIDFIRTYRPGILAIQEADLLQVNYLEDLFSANYEYFGIPRDAKDGEGNGILVDFSVFRLVDYGNMSNSTFPYEIGKVSWNSSCPRITTWVHLTSELTGDILIINVHLDYLHAETRKLSIESILTNTPKVEKTMIIGDFNGMIENGEFKELMSDFEVAGLYDERGTFHDFTGVAKERLDYIFFKGFRCENYFVYLDAFEGIFPSDHFPISCEFNKI